MTLSLTRALAAAALLAAVAASAPAQSITESYAPTAPATTTGQYKASHGFVVNNGRPNGNSVIWSNADLGLQPEWNVDALADGLDIFPAAGPANPPGPAATVCRVTLIEFTVTPATLGCNPSEIRTQRNGNGAHSDTFEVKWSPPALPTAPALASDHLGIDPARDIDALAWRDRRKFPVWFSVDAGTAGQMAPANGGPLACSAADILWVPAAGQPPQIYLSADYLGLDANDDIDGLAIMNAPGMPQPPFTPLNQLPLGTIVFSLRAGSTHAQVIPADIVMGTNDPIGPGGLFRVNAPGVLGGWANAYHLGLGPSPVNGTSTLCGGGGAGGGIGDDLNGVRITDPMIDATVGNGPGPGVGIPGGLYLDNVTGGRRMKVDHNVNELITFTVADVWGGAATQIALFARYDIPCDARALTIPPLGTAVFFHDIVPFSEILFPVPAQITFFFSNPITLTAQGVAFGPSGFVSFTDAIVLNVEP